MLIPQSNFLHLFFLPMVHLYPIPDAEGLAKTKDFYLNRLGTTITDAEAYEVLNSVMRFLYLQTLPSEAIPEEPELKKQN